MNHQQLKCVINCDEVLHKAVLGVYAADCLPNLLSRQNVGFIANVDTQANPGSHWVAFFCENKYSIEFFCSFGNTYLTYFTKFLKHANLKFNEYCLQSSDTNVCGQHCLYYLIFRCRGFSMSDILHRFNTAQNDMVKLLNDILVNSYILQTFPFCFRM